MVRPSAASQAGDPHRQGRGQREAEKEAQAPLSARFNGLQPLTMGYKWESEGELFRITILATKRRMLVVDTSRSEQCVVTALGRCIEKIKAARQITANMVVTGSWQSQGDGQAQDVTR
jgi:hypothetical protein